MTTNMSDQCPDNEGGVTFGKAVCVCVQHAITDGYECLIISVLLTFWRRNYFFNFSTPCI